MVIRLIIAVVTTTITVVPAAAATFLVAAIREQKGYEIDRKKIHIVDDVKELGTYKANIEFGNGQSTEVEFEVVAE